MEGEWVGSAALHDVPAARGCRFAAGPAIPASIGALQMGARCKSFAHLGRFTASPLADRGRVRHGEGKVDNKDEGRWRQGEGRWGAREATKTPRERRPRGAHSHHPKGALIGPRGWREWAPKKAPKTEGERHPTGAHSRHPPGS